MDSTSTKVLPHSSPKVYSDLDSQDGLDPGNPLIKNEKFYQDNLMVEAKTRDKQYILSGSPSNQEFNQVANESIIPKDNSDLHFHEIYKTPEHYLKDITQQFNCDTDLNLYYKDRTIRAVDNAALVAVGIKLQSESLQEIFGNKKYLFRCYVGDTKTFEIPIDDEPDYIEVGYESIIYTTKEEDQALKLIYFGEPLAVEHEKKLEECLEKLKEVQKYSKQEEKKEQKDESRQLNQEIMDQKVKKAVRSKISYDSNQTDKKKNQRKGKKVNYEDEEDNQTDVVGKSSLKRSDDGMNDQSEEEDDDVDSEATIRGKNPRREGFIHEIDESSDGELSDYNNDYDVQPNTLSKLLLEKHSSKKQKPELNSSVILNQPIFNIPIKLTKHLGRVKEVRLKENFNPNLRTVILIFKEQALELNVDLTQKNLKEKIPTILNDQLNKKILERSKLKNEIDSLQYEHTQSQQIVQNIENNSNKINTCKVGIQKYGNFYENDIDVELVKQSTLSQKIAQLKNLFNIMHSVEIHVVEKLEGQCLTVQDCEEAKSNIKKLDIVKIHDYRFYDEDNSNYECAIDEEQFIIETKDRNLYVIAENKQDLSVYQLQLMEGDQQLNQSKDFKLSNAILALYDQVILIYKQGEESFFILTQFKNASVLVCKKERIDPWINVSNVHSIFKEKQQLISFEQQNLYFSIKQDYYVKLSDQQYMKDSLNEKLFLYNDCTLRGNKLFIVNGSVLSIINIYNISKQKHLSQHYKKNDYNGKDQSYDIKQLIPYYEDDIAVLFENNEIWTIERKGKSLILKLQKSPITDPIVRKVFISYDHKHIHAFMLVSHGQEKAYSFQVIGEKENIIQLELSKVVNRDNQKINILDSVLIFDDSQVEYKKDFYIFKTSTNAKDIKKQQKYTFTINIKKKVILPQDVVTMPFEVMRISTTKKGRMQKLIKDIIYFYKKGRIDRYDNKNNQLLSKINMSLPLTSIFSFQGSYLYIKSEDKIYFSDLLSLEANQVDASQVIDKDQGFICFDFKYDQVSSSFLTFTKKGHIRIIPALHINEKKIPYEQLSNKAKENEVIASWLYGSRLFIYTEHNQLQEWNIYNGKFIDFLNIDKISNYKLYKRISQTHLLLSENFQNHVKVIELNKEELKGGKALKDVDQNKIFKIKKIRQIITDTEFFINTDLSLFVQYTPNKEEMEVFTINFEELNADNNAEKIGSLASIYKRSQVIDISYISTDGRYILYFDNNRMSVESVFSQNKLRDTDGLTPQVNKDLNNIKNNSKLCMNFVSDRHICFITDDNILIGYDIFKRSEEFHFALQHVNETKFENIFNLIHHYQGQYLLSFMNDEYLFDMGNQTISQNFLIDNLKALQCKKMLKDNKTSINKIPITMIDFLETNEKLNVGFYYKNQSFYSSFSFNYYTWRLLERIQAQNLELRVFDKNLIRSLIKIQLPNGKSLLHYIQFQEYNVRYLFDNFGPDCQDQDKLFIPILSDYEGRNIFDFYLERIQDLQNCGTQRTQEQNQGNNNKNKDMILNIIQYILEKLEPYPFNLFNFSIHSIVEIYLNNTDNSNDMKIISDFLLSRCKSIKFLSYVNKGDFDHDFHPIITFTQPLLFAFQEDYYRYKFGTQSIHADKIEVKVLDTARFYRKLQDNKKEYQFLIFGKLLNGSKDDIILNPIIKGIIELNWRYIRIRIYVFVIGPFLAFMGLFYLYTIYDLESIYTVDENFWAVKYSNQDYNVYDSINLQIMSKTCRILMLLLVLYFLIIEAFQMAYAGFLSYITQIWNRLELLLYATVLIAELLTAITRYSSIDKAQGLALVKVVRTMYSIATILMWIKFLYIFRIRRSTGYYIRMLVEVLGDILNFMFIFVSIVMCFAQAMYIFLLNSQEDVSFDTMYEAIVYAYFLPFGQFNTSNFSDYNTWICWIYFAMAQIILMIVLLNLLIAIVNDTFNRIKGNYQMHMYRDMITLTNENRFLYKPLFQCRCRTLWKREKCRGYILIRIWRKIFRKLSKKKDKYMLLGIPIEEMKIEDILKETNSKLSQQIANGQKDMDQAIQKEIHKDIRDLKAIVKNQGLVLTQIQEALAKFQKN